MTKYIFITGGVVSSLGKGIASASLASILEPRGLNVTLLKLDPYINVDPGTMSPFQHGEVFVTNDGAETDLDLGHYERFVRTQLGKKNNFTAGRVLQGLCYIVRLHVYSHKTGRTSSCALLPTNQPTSFGRPTTQDTTAPLSNTAPPLLRAACHVSPERTPISKRATCSLG